MAVYSVDKLITEARKIAVDYRKATGKALPGVSAEVSMHDAARLLDLELVKENGLGYDAIGRGTRAGLKYQIKSRVIFDEQKSGHRLGQLRTEQNWDRIVMVLMDEDLETYEIYEVSREMILDELEKMTDSKRSKRGAMSVARFKMIGHLAWTREEGVLENELWHNHS